MATKYDNVIKIIMIGNSGVATSNTKVDISLYFYI